MGLQGDVSGDISPELQSAILFFDKNHEETSPPDLADLQQAIFNGLPADMAAAGRLEDDPRLMDRLGNEVERLIDRFGPEALARDFIRTRASDDMSAVIRQVASERNDPESPPTLGIVRERIADGVLNELMAQGNLDVTQQSALIREIDELIELHGRQAPAEAFLGAEMEH